MVLLSKYWRLILPLIIFVLFYIGITVWKNDIEKAAVNEVIYEIKSQTNDKILEDITVVTDSFKPNKTIDQIAQDIINKDENTNTDINSVSNSRVQQSEISDSGLYSTENSTTIPDKRNSKTRPSMGDEYRLSTDEIDFITNNPELLQ